MNKLLRGIIAFLGGVNVAFSIFIPIALVLLMITVLDLAYSTTLFLLIIGIISSVYRAIKFWVIE